MGSAGAALGAGDSQPEKIWLGARLAAPAACLLEPHTMMLLSRWQKMERLRTNHIIYEYFRHKVRNIPLNIEITVSKMSSAGSQGQERKVICRACDFDNELLLKNYERHLVRYHPQENPKDPRGKGPKPVTISALFYKQKRKLEVEVEGESDGAASLSHKPRHSSGDSGIGVPETDQDTGPSQPDSPFPRRAGTTEDREDKQESSVFLRGDGNTLPSSGSVARPELELLPVAGGARDEPGAGSCQHVLEQAQGERQAETGLQESHSCREFLQRESFQRHDGKATGGDGDSNHEVLQQVLKNQEKVLQNQDKILVRLGNAPQSQASLTSVFLRRDGNTVTASDESDDSASGPDLRSVTNVQDFEKYGFKHLEEKSVLQCNLCEAEFKTAGHLDVDGKIHPREFRNLKSHLKRHFSSKKHLDKEEEVRKEKEEKKYLVSRDQKAGKNLARAAYSVIKSRNPEIHFEREVFLIFKAGGEVGNLNHSKNFVPKMRPYFASSVRKLLTEFLTNPMPQTGLLPPLAITFDGATYQRYLNIFLW